MAGWQEFSGLNRGYVLELYEKYRQDPASVDAETRAIFEQWSPPAEAPVVHDGIAYAQIVGAARLAQAIRRYGHLSAKLDPLGLRVAVGDPSEPREMFFDKALVHRPNVAFLTGPFSRHDAPWTVWAHPAG